MLAWKCENHLELFQKSRLIGYDIGIHTSSTMSPKFGIVIMFDMSSRRINSHYHGNGSDPKCRMSVSTNLVSAGCKLLKASKYKAEVHL